MPTLFSTHRVRSLLVKHEAARGVPPLSACRRGYGRTWQRLAHMFKREHPLCADPFGFHRSEGTTVPAAHIDHIIALAAGGTNEWSNLQSLCASCHSRKTVRCDGGFGNKARIDPRRTSKRTTAGWPRDRDSRPTLNDRGEGIPGHVGNVKEGVAGH